MGGYPARDLAATKVATNVGALWFKTLEFMDVEVVKSSKQCFTVVRLFE